MSFLAVFTQTYLISKMKAAKELSPSIVSRVALCTIVIFVVDLTIRSFQRLGNVHARENLDTGHLRDTYKNSN